MDEPSVAVESFNVEDDAFRRRVATLWETGRLLVYDRASFRLVNWAKGASQLDAQ